MDGLSFVTNADFQAKINANTRKWDKEWLRYLSSEKDYRKYFYDMDTPHYALTQTPERISKLLPFETYTTKLFQDIPAQIWVAGEALVGKNILEIGCGPGLLGRIAARFAGRYIGIDASLFAISIAKLTSPGSCTYIHLGEAAKMEKLRGYADICVGRHFFIHQNLQESLWLLRMIKECMRPQGVISADFYYAPDRVGDPRRYSATDALDAENTSSLYSFEAADIERAAAESNLKIIEIVKRPDLERHFALMTQKV